MKIKFGDMPGIIQIVKGQGHIQTQSLSLHYMDRSSQNKGQRFSEPAAAT